MKSETSPELYQQNKCLACGPYPFQNSWDKFYTLHYPRKINDLLFVGEPTKWKYTNSVLLSHFLTCYILSPTQLFLSSL